MTEHSELRTALHSLLAALGGSHRGGRAGDEIRRGRGDHVRAAGSREDPRQAQFSKHCSWKRQITEISKKNDESDEKFKE